MAAFQFRPASSMLSLGALARTPLHLGCRTLRPPPLQPPPRRSSVVHFRVPARAMTSVPRTPSASVDGAAREAVRTIHASDTRAVVYVTGGASASLSWLLTEPGASATVLEATVPYARSSFARVADASALSSFASMPAAQALAAAAYKRGVSLADPGARVLGVGAACALVSASPRRGEHRAHVVVHSPDCVASYSLTLCKQAERSRAEEDGMSSLLVLQALLNACDATTTMTVDSAAQCAMLRKELAEGDTLHTPSIVEFDAALPAVLSGALAFAERFGSGPWNRGATRATIVFPGSFNPLHDGHRGLMAAATAMFPGEPCAFELAARNADKAPLNATQLAVRAAQFEHMNDAGVLLSSAALFADKAKLYGPVRFIVGMDTLVRVLDDRYYEHGAAAALADLRARGCSFVVAGRLQQKKGTEDADTAHQQQFQTLRDARIPAGFEDMFIEIEPTVFRVDISSSELRAKARREGRESDGA